MRGPGGQAVIVRSGPSQIRAGIGRHPVPVQAWRPAQGNLSARRGVIINGQTGVRQRPEINPRTYVKVRRV